MQRTVKPELLASVPIKHELDVRIKWSDCLIKLVAGELDQRDATTSVLLTKPL
jgi:hypothetical protein